MKTVKLNQVNYKRWRAKKDEQPGVDRGLSTLAITQTMEKVEKALDLNIQVSERLLKAVEALEAKLR